MSCRSLAVPILLCDDAEGEHFSETLAVLESDDSGDDDVDDDADVNDDAGSGGDETPETEASPSRIFTAVAAACRTDAAAMFGGHTALPHLVMLWPGIEGLPPRAWTLDPGPVEGLPPRACTLDPGSIEGLPPRVCTLDTGPIEGLPPRACTLDLGPIEGLPPRAALAAGGRHQHAYQLGSQPITRLAGAERPPPAEASPEKGDDIATAQAEAAAMKSSSTTQGTAQRAVSAQVEVRAAAEPGVSLRVSSESGTTAQAQAIPAEES